MRKQLMTLALALGLVFGGVVVAQADPGPHHGGNAKGLCTAYFNGQKKGHDGGSPGPFASLEATAEAADQTVYEWCMANASIGGNGEHGRYPECFDDIPDNGSDMCPDN